jgi:SAM-dependent methyltransferase
MVSEYNTGALNQGIPADEMRAVVGNLIDASPSPELDGEEYFGFDVAAVGLGFHHFTDPGRAASRLAERLREGGTLFIVDFLPHTHWGGGHGHGHGHGGGGHEHVHGERNAKGKGHDHGKAEGETTEEDKKEIEKRGVTHMGFSEQEARTIFENAGVGKDFEYVVLGKGIVFSKEGREMRREVFIARGRKG